MFNIRVQRHEGYYKLSMPKYIDTLIPRREAEGAKGALHVEELSRNSPTSTRANANTQMKYEDEAWLAAPCDLAPNHKGHCRGNCKGLAALIDCVKRVKGPGGRAPHAAEASFAGDCIIRPSDLLASEFRHPQPKGAVAKAGQLSRPGARGAPGLCLGPGPASWQVGERPAIPSISISLFHSLIHPSSIRVQRHEGYYKLSMPKYIDTLIPRREAEGAKGALHVEELSRNSLLLRLHHG